VKLFVKNLLFTILVPGAVAVYVPLLITPDRSFTNNAFLLVVGFLLLGMGTGIYIWTVWDFASFGRGTSLPLDAPKRFVVETVGFRQERSTNPTVEFRASNNSYIKI